MKRNKRSVDRKRAVEKKRRKDARLLKERALFTLFLGEKATCSRDPALLRRTLKNLKLLRQSFSAKAVLAGRAHKMEEAQECRRMAKWCSSQLERVSALIGDIEKKGKDHDGGL